LELANMNKGTSGEPVIALQSTLSRLGYTILESERGKGVYGDGTKNVIFEFQKKNSLRPTGRLNKGTVPLLTVQTAGVQLPVKGRVLISGVVTRILSRPWT
jgi:peptidoglycan hydrolase-like protein with peptidoglycan-binding domain